MSDSPFATRLARFETALNEVPGLNTATTKEIEATYLTLHALFVEANAWISREIEPDDPQGHSRKVRKMYLRLLTLLGAYQKRIIDLTGDSVDLYEVAEIRAIVA